MAKEPKKKVVDVKISLRDVPLPKVPDLVNNIKKTVPGATGSVKVSRPHELGDNRAGQRQISDNRSKK